MGGEIGKFLGTFDANRRRADQYQRTLAQVGEELSTVLEGLNGELWPGLRARPEWIYEIAGWGDWQREFAKAQREAARERTESRSADTAAGEEQAAEPGAGASGCSEQGNCCNCPE